MALRLGLLSTARINDAILAAAAATSLVDVVAVASRDRGRAEKYAAVHQLEHAHASYEALLLNPEVDAVYISTPNGLHVEGALLALEAGKHVLCEKPLSRSAAAAEQAFDAAERNDRVLAEGFMYRHHPQIRLLGELLSARAIGELRLVRASFGFRLDRRDDPRMSPELGGGSLMDVGCYCVNAARFIAGGEPATVAAIQVIGGGVDVRMGAIMRFSGDLVALIDCGFDLVARAGIEISGSSGSMTLADPWHARREPGIVLDRGEGAEWLSVEPADSYRLELEDFAAAVAGEGVSLLGREDGVGQARAIEMIYAAAAG